MTRYIVYTFYGLYTLTKEIANKDEIIDEFGSIPNGCIEGRDRYMKCIKLTRNNMRRFTIDERDISFSETVPGYDDMPKEVQKKFRYEWSERSW